MKVKVGSWEDLSASREDNVDQFALEDSDGVSWSALLDEDFGDASSFQDQDSVPDWVWVVVAIVIMVFMCVGSQGGKK